MKEVYNVTTRDRNEDTIYLLSQEQLEKIVRHSIERTLTVVPAHRNVKQCWEKKLFPQAGRIIQDCLEEEMLDQKIKGMVDRIEKEER